MLKILITLLLFSTLFTFIPTSAQGTDSQILTIPKKLKVFCPQINEQEVKSKINELKNQSNLDNTFYLNTLANQCRKEDIDNYFKNQNNEKAYEAVFEFLTIIAPLQRTTNNHLVSAKSLLPIINYPLVLTEFVQPNNWLCLPNLTGVVLIENIQLKDKKLNLQCNHPLNQYIDFNNVGKYFFGTFFIVWLFIAILTMVSKILYNLQLTNPESTFKVVSKLVTPLIEKALISASISIMFILLFNGYNIGAKLLTHYADTQNSSFCNSETNIKCISSSLLQIEQRKLLVTTKADDLPGLNKKSKGLWGIFPETRGLKSIEEQAQDIAVWAMYLLLYVVIACILLYITLGFMAIQFMTWIKLIIQFVANQLMLYTSADPVANFKEVIYLFRTSFLHLISLIGGIFGIVFCLTRFNLYTVSIGLVVGFILLIVKGAALFDYSLNYFGFNKDNKKIFDSTLKTIKSNSLNPVTVIDKTLDVANNVLDTSKSYIDVKIKEPQEKLKNIKLKGIDFTKKIIPPNVVNYVSSNYKKTNNFIKNKFKK